MLSSAGKSLATATAWTDVVGILVASDVVGILVVSDVVAILVASDVVGILVASDVVGILVALAAAALHRRQREGIQLRCHACSRSLRWALRPWGGRERC